MGLYFLPTNQLHYGVGTDCMWSRSTVSTCKYTAVVAKQPWYSDVFVTFWFWVIMSEWIGQRMCIKFCMQLGDMQLEVIGKKRMVFGNKAHMYHMCYEWYNHFKDTQNQLRAANSLACPYHQKSRNNNLEVWKLVMEDCKITIRETVIEVRLLLGSCLLYTSRCV